MRDCTNAGKPLSSSLHLGLAVEPGPGIQATLPRSPIQLLVLQGLFFWPACLCRIRERFYQYSWPGNVRELENVIQAIAALGNEEGFYQKINHHGLSGVCCNRKEPTSTADALNGSTSQLLTRYTLKDLSRKAARKAEIDTILDVLTHTRWNRRKAAALLKTSYRTLLNKM